jgi:hypothetical protein
MLLRVVVICEEEVCMSLGLTGERLRAPRRPEVGDRDE